MTIRTNLQRTVRRTRLLDAARGWLDETQSPSSSSSGVLRCFPLYNHHVNPSPPAPVDFHSTLCDLIRNAKQRVTLASLYIGPAADSVYEKEVELLDALREVSAKKNIDITILLDQHRALRPVPVKGSKSKTITSAHACKQAIAESSGRIHLLSVLPPLLDRLLPNPYNEVAGVFHIKAYIIDDNLILSGANLSEEYFVDRIDRYLWVTSPDLVQCYEDMVQALCSHGVVYNDHGSLTRPKTTRKELINALKNILTTHEPENFDVDKSHGPEDPVAYAVPTFHAPPSYMRGQEMFRSDHHVLLSLFKESSNQQTPDNPLACRVATAYLNPTDQFLQALRNLQVSHFLTAGRVSHGFKPKPKAGNKGKDWIPTVFEHSAQLASMTLDNVVVSYYQRPDWSFHAKGIWLTDGDSSSTKLSHDNIRLSSGTSLYAVTHGSSNYGQRSAHRDMESNLLLILPEDSRVANEHKDEWNSLCDFAVSAKDEGARPIQPQIKTVFPVIRSFF